MLWSLTTSNESVSSLLNAVAVLLEGGRIVSPPEWAQFVKTGSHAERVPQSPKFWFERCASILLAVDRKVVGVQRLRNKYGGRTSNTVSRSHHRKAGGKIIRVAFQQLEKAGLVEKKQKKGRTITPAGKALIAKAGKALAA